MQIAQAALISCYIPEQIIRNISSFPGVGPEKPHPNINLADFPSKSCSTTISRFQGDVVWYSTELFKHFLSLKNRVILYQDQENTLTVEHHSSAEHRSQQNPLYHIRKRSSSAAL